MSEKKTWTEITLTVTYIFLQIYFSLFYIEYSSLLIKSLLFDIVLTYLNCAPGSTEDFITHLRKTIDTVMIGQSHIFVK